jgi:cytochrome c biogenesis protein CcmG/thiol:disulfide interchange protein DsbE
MNATVTAKPRRWAIWLPLILFLAFLLVVLIGLLWPASRDVPSEMIGKPLPAFNLPAAVPERPGLATADFGKGKPRLLNVFASWCIPCAVESPQLEQLRRAGVEIDGIAIRDRTEELEPYLARYGNPYTRIGVDNISAVQLAIGSSGVPESFIIDGDGKIFYQHIGDIRPEEVQMILDKLKEAEG